LYEDLIGNFYAKLLTDKHLTPHLSTTGAKKIVVSGVTRGGWPPQVTPSRGGVDTRRKKCGWIYKEQWTNEVGWHCRTDRRWWLKKVVRFSGKKGWHRQLPPRVTPTLVTPLIVVAWNVSRSRKPVAWSKADICFGLSVCLSVSPHKKWKKETVLIIRSHLVGICYALPQKSLDFGKIWPLLFNLGRWNWRAACRICAVIW